VRQANIKHGFQDAVEACTVSLCFKIEFHFEQTRIQTRDICIDLSRNFPTINSDQRINWSPRRGRRDEPVLEAGGGGDEDQARAVAQVPPHQPHQLLLRGVRACACVRARARACVRACARACACVRACVVYSLSLPYNSAPTGPARMGRVPTRGHGLPAGGRGAATTTSARAAAGRARRGGDGTCSAGGRPSTARTSGAAAAAARASCASSLGEGRATGPPARAEQRYQVPCAPRRRGRRQMYMYIVSAYIHIYMSIYHM
jgi:hypothetical protein